MVSPVEIGVGLAAIAVLVAVLWLISRRRSYTDSHARRLHYSADGVLTHIGEREPDTALRFRGTGTWSSQPLLLPGGDYRITYQFPEGTLVRVGIISSASGDDETLLIKQGSGVESVTLENGRYVLKVQPADESTAWQLECQRIQRLGDRTAHVV